MFKNALVSEWRKHFSTRAPFVLYIVYSILSLAWAVGVGFACRTDWGKALFTPSVATTGMFMAITFSVFMYLMAAPVINEYSHKTIVYTHLSVPNRIKAALSKLLVSYGVSTGIFTVLAYLCNLAFILPQVGNIQVKPTIDNLVWGPLSLFIAFAAVVPFIHGLVYILRNTAAVMAITIISFSGMEGIISIIPKTSKIGEYLFFKNASDVWSSGSHLFEQETLKSMVIIFIWAVVVYGLGLLSVTKRDT